MGAQKLIAYTRGVIDSLDIKHGPTHAEVIMTSDGTPCLVEMNCRAHGWDGAWAPLLTDVRAFLENEPMPCIVKPTESCGSDGVKKCNTIQEAEAHFDLLMHSQKKAGAQDCAVICQEFLAGQEYVVDHVSRDGKHKTVMVWVYDKRPTNGGEFVYYNMLPVESSDPVAQKLISYTRGVIDALDIKHGPTHAEVMMTCDGTPCLVEMNCRAHGWDGAWAPLERALVGYSQVEA